MILCDVNVLIHAHREENPGHLYYKDWLQTMLEGKETFLYCEWILSGFVRIVTHPGIYRTPTPINRAFKFASQIRSRPNAIGIMPGARHWRIFEHLCRKIRATANLVPDAYMAALAIEASARWMTADEDYALFEPELTWDLLRP